MRIIHEIVKFYPGTSGEILFNKTDTTNTLMDERSEVLFAHIKKLSDIEKSIILLYLEGKTYEEIANISGFSSTNIGTILMPVILPVMGKLISGKDLFTATSLWFCYAIAFPFFYAFTKCVFKSYNKITTDAENILKELEA